MSIKLKGSSDGSVSFDAPADTSPSGSDITLTLPTSAGSADQFLKNSGIAGELEYSSMVETSTGVGIGTTSPAAVLSVEGTSQLVHKYTGASSPIQVGQFNSSGDASINNQANAPLLFATNNTERVRIDTSGRLLIGLTSASSSAKFIVRARTSDANGYGNMSVQKGSAPTTSNPTLGVLSFTDNSERQAAYILSAFDAGTWTDGSSHPGRLVFATTANGASSSTERMRLTSSGRLLVNKTSSLAGEVLSVANSGSSGNTAAFTYGSTDDRAIVITLHNGSSGSTSRPHYSFLNSGGFEVGSIKATGSATSFNTSSDYRLKENVVDLDGAIIRVKQLAPKRFNFIADADTTVDGFIAHEAQTVVPEAVSGTHDEVDDDGNAVMQGIDQSKLVPLLTAALQEAIAKIETLETKVAALEAA
jgi:hypothetical protein